MKILNLAYLVSLLVIMPAVYGAAADWGAPASESQEVMSSQLCADGLEAEPDLAAADQHWLLGRLMTDFKGAERKALAACDDLIEAHHLMIAALAADHVRGCQLYRQLYEPILVDLSQARFKAQENVTKTKVNVRRGLAVVGIDGNALLERSRQRVRTVIREDVAGFYAVIRLKTGDHLHDGDTDLAAQLIRQKMAAGTAAPYEAQRAAIKIQQAVRQHQRQIREDVAQALGK